MIPIIIFARQQSERCKDKALRPFHNNMSLTEIMLDKFKNRNDVYLAGGEDIFETLANKYNIGFMRRPEQSVMGETLEDIYCFLKDSDLQDLASINVCTPFTQAKTIDDSIKYYKENNLLSLMPAFETYEIILDKNKHPLNDDADELNSKTRSPLYFMANNHYIFNLPRFWKNNGKLFPKYADNDPYFYPISYTESLDIDTEEQFNIVQSTYAHKAIN